MFRREHISIHRYNTIDSASNYSVIQKLKPWLQTQDIPKKWEYSYMGKSEFTVISVRFLEIQVHLFIVCIIIMYIGDMFKIKI
jgi:hypothetical protein